MKETTTIPNLRFREFTQDWTSVRLGDICSSFKSGNNITASQIKNTGLYPVFGGNGLRGFTDTFTHDGFYLLIGRQGALCGNINRTKGKSYISEHAIAVQANSSSDTEWLAQKLDYMNLNQYSESSAQPGLSVNKIVKLKLYVPQVTEQQKIADFLTAVDTKIRQLTYKKTLLEKYKKGVSQQIFNQELRFKDADGTDFAKWEEKTLGELGDTYNGLTGKTKDDFGRGMPYITYRQIFSSSKIDSQKFELVNIEPNERQNKVILGDVFFTTSSETANEIGFASVLLDPVEDLYLNSFCFGYRLKSHKQLTSQFSQYLFRSDIFRKSIVTLAQGSTRYNMSKIELMKVKVKLPTFLEQQKIANFLTSIDNKIGFLAQQLQQTQTFKNGLLQQMFI